MKRTDGIISHCSRMGTGKEIWMKMEVGAASIMCFIYSFHTFNHIFHSFIIEFFSSNQTAISTYDLQKTMSNENSVQYLSNMKGDIKKNANR